MKRYDAFENSQQIEERKLGDGPTYQTCFSNFKTFLFLLEEQVLIVVCLSEKKSERKKLLNLSDMKREALFI